MYILARYILKEHVGPFFFSLAVIMFVFVTKFIVQYIGKIFGKGLPFHTILEFIYLNLAWMLALAVPMAVLIASLMAFGRLSADNEITILKTSGISLYKIIRPVLIVGVLLTVLMYLFNDRVLPEYNHRARLLFTSISQKKPTLQLEEGLYLNMGKFSILVQGIEKSLGERMADKGTIMNPDYTPEGADRLKDITIFDRSSENYQRTVIARRGHLIFDPQKESLVFTLYDGEIHEIGYKDLSEYRRMRFNRNVFYIPAPELVFKRAKDEWRGDREMTTKMMENEIKKYRQSIQKEKQKIQQQIGEYLQIALLEATSRDETKRPSAAALPDRGELALLTPSSQANPAPSRKLEDWQLARSKALRQTQATIRLLKNSQKNIAYFEKVINKYKVEIYKKLSIPFACIVFILVGAPLGIRARKGSLAIGATFSIGFFLLYWVCLIGGEELADRRILPAFWAMWFPNIIVGFWGVYMTYRTVKETTFIRWEKLPKFLQLFFKGEEQPQ